MRRNIQYARRKLVVVAVDENKKVIIFWVIISEYRLIGYRWAIEFLLFPVYRFSFFFYKSTYFGHVVKFVRRNEKLVTTVRREIKREKKNTNEKSLKKLHGGGVGGDRDFDGSACGKCREACNNILKKDRP